MCINIFQSIISGVVSGIIASMCFTLLLFIVKPKIKILDHICMSKGQNNSLIYKIKIVNKSLVMVTNINYSLRYIEMNGDKISKVSEIQPRNSPILVLDGFNRSHKKEKTHYAIRISYNIDPAIYPINNDKCRFEFIFLGQHSITNATVYIKKQYYYYDIWKGIFEEDDSVNIKYTSNI